MNKFVVIKAATVDLAVEQALDELNVSPDKVDVEVMSKGGLFQKAEVKVSLKDTLSDKVAELVNGILERMKLSSRAEVKDVDNTLYITVAGADSGTVIGYRGEVLDALQYLVLTFLNQEKYDYKKVVVDAENYREKRRETLTALAFRLAEKAQRTCRKVALEPMNPFERRIIHSALADSDIAETISEGEEPNRHIVIIPKGVEIIEGREKRPMRNNDSRQYNRNDGRNNRNRSNGDRRERTDRFERPFKEETEVEDGREFRGLYLGEDEFVKPEVKKVGPPKFKSFGGQKKF